MPNDQDGVPFITQPPVKPGERYIYEFTVPMPVPHMYYSHHNAALQVGQGLLGAFIVEPRRPVASHRADVDYVMVLNDGSHGFTLNGKSFPATEPIVCQPGQTVRIRYMNEGMMIHPMHLHGMHMTVIAKDGWDQPAPWKCDTLNIAPGERWEVLSRRTTSAPGRSTVTSCPTPNRSRGDVRHGHGADREAGHGLAESESCARTCQKQLCIHRYDHAAER